MVNSGVVAAIHVAGMRYDPCGAVRWTQSNAGVDHRDFKFSVLNFKKILKF